MFGGASLLSTRGVGNGANPTATLAGEAGMREAHAASDAESASASMRSSTPMSYATLYDTTFSREGARWTRA